MMTADDALKAMIPFVVKGKDAEMQAYHKAERVYLGVANPDIDTLQKAWRKEMTVEERVELARNLWDSDVHEGRVAAAKLLTQARLRPDDVAWELIKSWVPQFDGWAIADHAMIAAQKRLVADPSRMEDIRPWTTSDHMWTKRAAMVATLPWAKLNNLKAQDQEIREEVLTWAADYVQDRTWFIQKSVAWWLRELSKHDADRVTAFLGTHGDALRPSLRKEAVKYLK